MFRHRCKISMIVNRSETHVLHVLCAHTLCVCVYCGDVCKRCNPLGNAIMILPKILCRMRVCNGVCVEVVCVLVFVHWCSFLFVRILSKLKPKAHGPKRMHTNIEWQYKNRTLSIERLQLNRLTELVRVDGGGAVMMKIVVAREHHSNGMSWVWIEHDSWHYVIYLDSWLTVVKTVHKCELYRIRSI